MVKSRKIKDKNIIHNWNNLPGLISFEEVTDYNITRGQGTNTTHDRSKIASSEKRKKRKRNARKSASDRSSIKQKRKIREEARQPSKKRKISPAEDVAKSEPIDSSNDPLNFEVMTAWNEFTLPEPVLKALAFKKFLQPTEIQVKNSLNQS